MNPTTRGGSAVAGPSRFLLWSALVLAIACAATSHQPPPVLAEVWRDYRGLPDQRALAIAGNLRQDRFVAGLSGGHATIPEAEAAALRECGARRQRARQQAACQIYAIGDEIVWPGREGSTDR